MNKRIETLWKIFLGGSALGVFYYGVVGPLVLNLENTRRIAGALIPPGRHISCADGVLPRSTTRPYDAIGVFGAGKDINDTGGYEPNSFGKARLKGAALARAAGEADSIILVGDAVALGPEGLSLGQRYLEQAYRVPQDVIFITDGEEGNTETDAQQLAGIAKTIGAKRIRLSDTLAHGNRSAALSCTEGVAVDWFAVDDGRDDPIESAKLFYLIFDPHYFWVTRARLATLPKSNGSQINLITTGTNQ